MTATYIRSIAVDFDGTAPNPRQLHNEIDATDGIPDIVGVTVTGDEVLVIFVSALSEGQETILDSLIHSHVPDVSKPKNNFYTVYPKKSNIGNKNYTMVARFTHGGSGTVGPINYVEIIARMDKDATSYSVRIYDVTNDTILVERTGIDNTEPAIQDMGTILNVPVNGSLLELHIMVVADKGKPNVYVDQIKVYHGN